MTAFRVGDQLCFALYDASRAVVGRYRTGLERIGLTYTQYLVMMLLWERSPQPVHSLGEGLNLDSGTLSPLLKRLEAQGLVSRRRLPEDERNVEIALTSSGRDLRARARRVQVDVERATGLDTEAVASLRKQLHVLAAQLRDDTGEQRA